MTHVPLRTRVGGNGLLPLLPAPFPPASSGHRIIKKPGAIAIQVSITLSSDVVAFPCVTPSIYDSF
ncbi:hypothetical protein HCG51_28620 [Tolypothrix sp. PCC 7910]|uniref:hypothetical protein n=1 Tax=Tolypothrix sp. PCC 7910 TaxID=2099387 RepID=UPI001427964E|nr:hypothetical protein [Tolypothrix sp. PCC 7910]QIR40287.1 hypothetical protein HCG51_28620 [Tolypothrix sp. PCC 7910]